MECRPIKCAEFEKNFFELTKEHYKEIGVTLNVDKDPTYDVNKAQFYTLEQIGRYHIMGLYDKNNEPVGYINAFTENHIYSQDMETAHIHAVYVKEEARNTGEGSKLYNEFEKYLKSIGVKMIQISVGGRGDLSQFLTHKGYSQVDIIYGKILEEK